MARFCKFDYERACALDGRYTLNVQSNDAETMISGLAALLDPATFNAHLHRSVDAWCAIVATDSLEALDALSERLAGVGLAHRRWVRLMVWDEERQRSVFDRTYTADGEMHEPIPA